ncbi:MAG: hypothetical protein KC994_19585, partial [Candidatus Omnitrophica bacterium]|nr:hypothetical protein [Candidatus Omnitrophota bacterium]
SRGGTSFPGCGLVSEDETEVMTLSPNEDGTHLSGSFLFSVEYTDGTAESQRFAIEMDGGNGEF